MKNGKAIANEGKLVVAVKDDILPLLQEYCYDDYSTLKEILGSKIVDERRGGFLQGVFSSKGRDIIIDFMKDMVAGDGDIE